MSRLPTRIRLTRWDTIAQRKYGLAVERLICRIAQRSRAPIFAAMSFRQQDERFMQLALAEAKKGLGQTSPNPAVGAVLVYRNRVVAKAHHRQAGAPHAEAACLREFGRRIPPEATLYVTLEPCSTIGRTGPCTRKIIDAGVRNVVIGTLDVNPKHCGRAVPQLRAAGVQVRSDVLAEECARLNEAFNKWIVTRRPFVIAKCGMSLDGRLSRRPREPRWITDAPARRHAHTVRAQVDAIMIGAETVRTDDPRLTARGVGKTRQPWRIVLTRSGNLPAKARLFSDRWAKRTLVYQHMSLGAVLRELGQKEITSVLIEGGGQLLGEALDAALIDKVHIYVGPMLTGGPVIAIAGRGVDRTSAASQLAHVSYTRIGQNVCIVGYPQFDNFRK
jgi:diaminohydroxyphosphoribosylaminopyrimidine deaminase / 5-amino-6-(5-phosphoribosylamino)uracil reductase